MRPRDPEETGRTASPLELFFDLVFVVAVSIAAGELHHALADAHVVDGLVAYGIVFFGIWWAWMNFTWFATSFATDDWLYRVLTFVQMAGVLVLAAGIEAAFTDRDYTLLVFAYVVMRIAMVAQWLRASRHAGDSRRATQIYAAGIAAVQVFWLVMLTLPDTVGNVVLVVLVAAELAVPILAEKRAPHRGTRTTSPSGTACSPSSCSARACSPPPTRSSRRSTTTRPSDLSSASRSSPSS